jgi:ribosomal protein S18 acetylase RimI-like enzyme
MQLRPVQASDLDAVADIDATLTSNAYLHLIRDGEGIDVTWRIEERPLREPLRASNMLNDEARFAYRQLAGGIEEGVAVLAEHDGVAAAALAAVQRPERGVLEIVDIRTDYDQRREGLATALMFQCIQHARTNELRAVTAEVLANNQPAANLLVKVGFDLVGLDERRHSNHDVVKESATMFWNLALD